MTNKYDEYDKNFRNKIENSKKQLQKLLELREFIKYDDLSFNLEDLAKFRIDDHDFKYEFHTFLKENGGVVVRCRKKFFRHFKTDKILDRCINIQKLFFSNDYDDLMNYLDGSNILKSHYFLKQVDNAYQEVDDLIDFLKQ